MDNGLWTQGTVCTVMPNVRPGGHRPQCHDHMGMKQGQSKVEGNLASKEAEATQSFVDLVLWRSWKCCAMGSRTNFPSGLPLRTHYINVELYGIFTDRFKQKLPSLTWSPFWQILDSLSVWGEHTVWDIVPKTFAIPQPDDEKNILLQSQEALRPILCLTGSQFWKLQPMPPAHGDTL